MAVDIARGSARAQQTREWLAAAHEERGAITIPCRGCGEPVGHYRPGRVRQASVELPRVRLKCVRAGCRIETLVELGELSV